MPSTSKRCSSFFIDVLTDPRVAVMYDRRTHVLLTPLFVSHSPFPSPLQYPSVHPVTVHIKIRVPFGWHRMVSPHATERQRSFSQRTERRMGKTEKKSKTLVFKARMVRFLPCFGWARMHEWHGHTQVRDGMAWASNFWPDVTPSAQRAAIKEWKVDPKEMLREVAGTGIEIDGKRFRTSEHYYQYAKYLHMDPTYAGHIYETCHAKTAPEIKSASSRTAYIKWRMESEKAKRSAENRGSGKNKQVKLTKKEIEKDLAQREMKLGVTARLDIMRRALRGKFDRTRHPTLVRALLKTGSAALSEAGGRGGKGGFWDGGYGGGDHLGKLLMELRADLASAPPA
jgi:predicted NAD-dependent protein-ADP-ribosyltransferase YbiA (DUF1768 family)